jgi:hypothetical protein
MALLPPIPMSFIDILKFWGNNTWLWEHLSINKGFDWHVDLIANMTLVVVINGSYMHELYPNLCSAAFVLECAKGRGQVVGKVMRPCWWQIPITENFLG